MEGSTSVINCRSLLYRPLAPPHPIPPKSQLKFQLSGTGLHTRTICLVSNGKTGSVVCSSPTLPTPAIEDQGKAASESPRTDEPKIDKSGRFCSPRAARELALLTVYAACLEGSDPVRLLDKRVNAPREPGYEFDHSSLLRYNHMSVGGPPITTSTIEEADELIREFDAESANEIEVLLAPPKLVYSKLLLRFTRKLLVAVTNKWDDHVSVIDKVVPPNWKNQPAARILEFSILHLAMSEISEVGTRAPIVINEAVDLAKRFCDGSAPRIINGCLRTFVKGDGALSAPSLRAERKIFIRKT